MKVFKYALPLDADNVIHECTVEIPEGAQILTVGVGTSGVNLLALVDEDAATVERTFIVIGNGIELPGGVSALHFRGAIKLPNLSLSVFETTEVTAAA